MPNHNIPHSPKSIFFLLLAAFPLWIFAQTPAVLESPNNNDDEIYTLEEFNVSAASLKNSYIASEATAGTRLSEKIVDLPYSIDVITSDFAEDWGLTTAEEMLAYIGGATGMTGDDSIMVNPGEPLASVTVRGFSPLATRDGFQYAMPSSITNTLQSEIIKGPLSTLYGRAVPGGIMNRVTRRPKKKTEYTATAMYGTDDFRRAAVTASGPLKALSPKLYYYAYFQFDKRGAWNSHIDHQKSEQFYYGLSLLYMFQKNTSLYATFEYQPIKAKEGLGAINAQLGGAKYVRSYSGGGGFNPYYAPNGFRDQLYYGANLLFEHRINRIWATRAALQTYNKDSDQKRWAGGNIWYNNGTTVDTFAARRPWTQNQTEEAIAVQYELLGTFKTPKAEHKILFAVDASYQKRHTVSHIANNMTETLPGTIVHLHASSPDLYAPLPDDSLIQRVNGDLKHNAETFGAFASYRASLFRSRLALMASVRYDSYSDKYTDGLNYAYSSTSSGDLPEGRPAKGSRKGNKLTYSLGLNYKIRGEKLLFYINNSSSYRPVRTFDRGLGALVPPQESSAIEFGFKGTSNNNRFGYTISFFDMTLENVSSVNDEYEQSIHAGLGTVPEYNVSGKQKSRGFDGNLFFCPTSNLTFKASFGYVDNEVKSGENSSNYHVGKPAALVAKWTAALTSVYKFKKGPFKGAEIGLSSRFRDHVAGYYEDSDYYGTRMPSLLLVDSFVAYKFKNGKARSSIRLNVNNILDKGWYTRGGRLAFGREARLTYILRY